MSVPVRGDEPGTAGRAWPDAVDAVLDGDQVVALAYATPARGAVIVPVVNFGVRDGRAGTVTVNSSVGLPKKLERIRRDPRVALAFHTRAHARHERPEYVLVQGRATLSEPVADFPATMLERWERFEPWAGLSRFWRWWLRVYATRVAIEIAVERIVVWPDLACAGAPEVLGAPLPELGVPAQRPPRGGTGPRLDHRRAARRAAGLPHALLGWIGADGFPVVVPVSVSAAEPGGIALRAAAGLVPAGGRRAGLTAHGFRRDALAQHQRRHTGWLDVAPARSEIVYAPHTDAGYRLPPGRLAYRLASGWAARAGAREARRAGLLP
jgi:nitroimidazol reductase NimA-like FMN-containing flavoprotein (pyridoxamine 5'-phosphate oxidase superfamily)